MRIGRLADSTLAARRIATARHVVVGTPTYFARAGEPLAPGDLMEHGAVVYDQKGAGAVWSFRRADTEVAVTQNGRLRVTAAEGVRAAVLAHGGIAVVSQWIFTPEIADGRVTNGSV